MQHPMLNIAIRAARRAGQIINRASFDLESIEISTKKRNDFVTEVDRACEVAIIETLLGAYPDHAILAEESGQSGTDGSIYRWIIDPLDGTNNFIHGFPYYCISIALEHKGVITQAVIYDPTRNDLFTASRGSGAFLNNRRIRVSHRERLSNALIGTGFVYDGSRDSPDVAIQSDPYFEIFAKMTAACSALRRPGAAALDLANVAAGRLDGFFEQSLNIWDLAGGSLLVSEAGGLIGNYMGEVCENFLESGEIAAANPKIYAQMIRILSPYSRTSYSKI
jgi:myo-inositol-1(or 4)-monophosphatase